MSKVKYWKFGDKYAGINKSGTRFVAESLSKIRKKLGLKSSTSAPKSKPKTQTKRKGTKTTSKKSKGKGKGGRKILGSIGWKGLLAGIAAMTLAKIGIRKFVPQVPQKYVDPLAMIAAGAIGKVANLPTKNLLPAGVISGGSSLVADLISGGLPTLGNGGRVGNGGYDV